MKIEFTGPRSHKGSETLYYGAPNGTTKHTSIAFASNFKEAYPTETSVNTNQNTGLSYPTRSQHGTIYGSQTDTGLAIQ